jgi:alpha-tubulin suppressor-like RCC1 family protein
MYQNSKKGAWSLEEVNAKINLNSWDEIKREYLWVAGSNSHGELGNQSIVAVESPIQIGSEEWSNFSAGDQYVLAQKADGSLWGWGRNNHGQFGNYETRPRSSPVLVSGADTYWRTFFASKAAGNHSLFIKTDGTLWASGHNNYGQLGLAGGVKAANYWSRTNLSQQVEIFGQADWQHCSTGRLSSLAIRGEGSLFCWGYNGHGQLGQNNTTNYSSPVQVTGKWNYARMYYDSTLAISEDDGYLYTWGDNTYGQLGDGSSASRSSPVQLSGGWKKVEGCNTSVLGIKYDGTMWSWGRDLFGVLGLDVLPRYTSPNAGLGTSWLNISGSLMGKHTLAVKQNNTLYSFGDNNSGQLGLNYQGDNPYQSSPTQILGATWTIASAGTNSSYALKSDGTLYAWGRNNNGQLGDITTIDTSSPVQIPGTSWANVSAGGDNFAFSIKTNGTLWSWGKNNGGQLGQSDTVDKSSPVQVGSLSTWADISCGNFHTLILRSDSNLFAVGINSCGQLGSNNRVNALEPTQVLGTGYETASAGNNFSLCKRTDGTLWAWGLNDCGQLGLNDRIPRSSPVQIPGTNWSKVQAGANNAIAFKNDGTMWGWGENLNGQLGTGDFLSYSSPVQVTSGYNSWNIDNNKKSSVSSQRTFVIHNQSDLYYMGAELDSGVSVLVPRSSPTQIPGTNWDDFAFSDTTVIAKKADGTQWTWGRTKWLPTGQITAITEYASSPVQLQGTLWKHVSIGPNLIVGTKEL